ncbi:MAG: hypothetical protein J0M34_00240 [Alphaproteobacteria bacterium]|nr:hypothetical protein [Alphaproteobacteria bacterium]
MAVSRVSTLSLFNRTQRDIGNTFSNLAELQGQLSSGFKSDNFKGLNGQVEQFTLLEARLRKIEQFKQNNAVTEARLRTADQALDQMVATADDIENLVVLRRSAAGLEGNMAFAQQLEDLMARLTNSMNTQFEGRYIFGGIDTANPPVEEPLPNPTEVGVPDKNYYLGSDTNITYRIDDRLEDEFPARADDVAFQNIIAGYHLALQADAADGDQQLGQALDLIQRGQEQLVAARSRVNTAIVNIDQTGARLDQMRVYLKGVTEQVSKTDTVAAATEVANHEAVLQATFQVYARLSQLRLSDYL